MSPFKDRLCKNLEEEIEASKPSKSSDATKVEPVYYAEIRIFGITALTRFKSGNNTKIRIFGITALTLSKSENKIRIFGLFPVLSFKTSEA